MKTNDEIDRLCSRHIAKCLDRLDYQLTKRDEYSIKRSFRFFAEDIKQVETKGDSNEQAGLGENPPTNTR